MFELHCFRHHLRQTFAPCLVFFLLTHCREGITHNGCDAAGSKVKKKKRKPMAPLLKMGLHK